jgi:hypothetical protein
VCTAILERVGRVNVAEPVGKYRLLVERAPNASLSGFLVLRNRRIKRRSGDELHRPVEVERDGNKRVTRGMASQGESRQGGVAIFRVAT